MMAQTKRPNLAAMEPEERTLFMLSHSETWPHNGGYVSMKRPKDFGFGLLFTGQLGFMITNYPTEKKFVESYPDAEAVVAAGWIVD